MNQKVLDEIRRDLDLLCPKEAYTLTLQRGQPCLRLEWDSRVHDNIKRFSEELLRLHDLDFESCVKDPGSREAP